MSVKCNQYGFPIENHVSLKMIKLVVWNKIFSFHIYQYHFNNLSLTRKKVHMVCLVLITLICSESAISVKGPPSTKVKIDIY